MKSRNGIGRTRGRLDGEVRTGYGGVSEGKGLLWVPRPGLTNLSHACPKWHTERFPWHVTFNDVPVYFIFLPDQSLYIVKNTCIYIIKFINNPYAVICIYIYIHIWLRKDCLWITVATNNTASETFLHKSRDVRSVDWSFFHWGTGLAVTQRIGDIGQKDLQSSFQTGNNSSHIYIHILFLIAFHQEVLLEIK